MRLERAVVRRIVALVLMGLVAGLWLVMRPGVVAKEPNARLLEFPIGVLVVALLSWIAARPARAREKPQAPWRRHEQVVRPLADPEVAPLAAALERWLADGEGAAEAADVLARALASQEPQRAQTRERLLARMAPLKSRRKRESLLRDVLETPEETVPFDPVPAAGSPGA